MRKLKSDKYYILISVVGILCVASIILQFKTENFLSITNSIIGLTGAILFFLKKDVSRYFIWTWIVAQILIIEHIFRDPTSGRVIKDIVFDLSQVFRVKIGFYISENQSSYVINLNLLTIVYIFLFKQLRTDSLIGKTFSLLFLRNNLDISFGEGTYVTLIQRVNLDGDDNWLLGELSKQIIYNQYNINKVLVYTEEGNLTNTFRIVPNDIMVTSGVNPLLKFERVDWMMI